MFTIGNVNYTFLQTLMNNQNLISTNKATFQQLNDITTINQNDFTKAAKLFNNVYILTIKQNSSTIDHHFQQTPFIYEH